MPTDKERKGRGENGDITTLLSLYAQRYVSDFSKHTPQVHVDAQYSGFFNSTAVTYAAPSIDAVSGNATFGTAGGESVIFKGKNFGPVGGNVTADLATVNHNSAIC
eukprot:38773-Amorphochlora_amoeboformis.AAC.1